MLTFGAQLLGEVRLLALYFDRDIVEGDAMDPFHWAPGGTVARLVAPMLQRIRLESEVWSMRHAYRRIQRDLVAAFSRRTYEWEWFDEVVT